MPLIKSMKNAKLVTLTVETNYGAATLSLFRHKGGCANPRMLMLVSHGWQLTPAKTVATQHLGINSFAFLVPVGVSLSRTRYDEWAGEAARKFASAPLAFATAGVPDLIVGAHYFESEDKSYAGALSHALPFCDIAVFDNITPPANPDQDFNQSAALPLSELLYGGQAQLRVNYSAFLMHCCRSPWTPKATSKGSSRVLVADGLYAFDDGFRAAIGSRFLVGGPDEVGEQAEAFRAVGIEGLTLSIPDVHDLDAVALAGRTLGPLFAAAAR
jgi:hypothetical protein